jgi:hypothetical protein
MKAKFGLNSFPTCPHKTYKEQKTDLKRRVTSPTFKGMWPRYPSSTNIRARLYEEGLVFEIPKKMKVTFLR